MTYYEYLQMRADACRGNGVEFMAQLLEKIIVDNGDERDLQLALNDAKRNEL